MIDLITVGLFVSFFLAVLSPVFTILSMMGFGGRVVPATTSILLSGVGLFLIEEPFGKHTFLDLAAAAFLGSFFLALAERASTYKPSVTTAIK